MHGLYRSFTIFNVLKIVQDDSFQIFRIPLFIFFSIKILYIFKTYMVDLFLFLTNNGHRRSFLMPRLRSNDLSYNFNRAIVKQLMKGHPRPIRNYFFLNLPRSNFDGVGSTEVFHLRLNAIIFRVDFIQVGEINSNLN